MKRFGFTLIELIIVIAVIGLLTAIVLPSLLTSKLQAKIVLCSSNIRQLYLGLLAYECDNQYLPFAFDDTRLTSPPGGWPGYLSFDRQGWWWFNYITDYSMANKSKKNILMCPSNNMTDVQFKDNILCGNYGANLSVCKCATGSRNRAEFVGTSLRLSDILHPAETLLIVDSGYSMISWWDAADTPPFVLSDTMEDTAYVPGLKINRAKTNLRPDQLNDAINGRHLRKTVNVGFADGHVSREKADNLLVEKIDNGYKNRTPLWQPKKGH